MNTQEYNIIHDFIQEVLSSKYLEDFIFDPLYKAHPKQEFSDLAYEIVAKLVNRFDFINWNDVEDPKHWVWKIINQELDKMALEDNDWDDKPWLKSPFNE